MSRMVDSRATRARSSPSSDRAALRSHAALLSAARITGKHQRSQHEHRDDLTTAHKPAGDPLVGRRVDQLRCRRPLRVIVAGDQRVPA